MNAHTSIDEAWSRFKAEPKLIHAFTAHCNDLNIPFSLDHPSSTWAYWTSRFVTGDHWPPAEELINLDKEATHRYRLYKRSCIVCGILGHTVNLDKRLIFKEDGRVLGWKPGQEPISVKIRNREYYDPELVAAQIESYKQRRVLDRKEEISDDDN